MINLIHRWHAAKRAVRRLEAKVMIAEAAENAGARRAVLKIFRKQLEEAQNAAAEAQKDCIDAARRRRESVTPRR
jgi:hypothetical protein